MSNRRLLIGLLLVAVAGLTHGQVYRCEQGGQIVFSDQTCERGAKATKKVFATSAAIGTLDIQIAVTHYSVQGQDYDSLMSSLRANGPKGFHGLASWNIRYDYTTKRRGDACQIDTVRTQVNGRILMPRWTDELSAPQALRRRWNDYYAALKWHEDGHIQHGKELALLVKERLIGLGVAPCDQMQVMAQKEFDRLYGNLKMRDQEYDARTNHGAIQGAIFRR